MMMVVMSSDSSMPSGLFWPTCVVEAPKGTGKDGTDGNPGRLERNERQGLGACRARTYRHDPARRGRAREPHRGHGQEIRVEEIPDPTLGEDAGDARTLSRRTQARRRGHRGTAQGERSGPRFRSRASPTCPTGSRPRRPRNGMPPPYVRPPCCSKRRASPSPTPTCPKKRNRRGKEGPIMFGLYMLAIYLGVAVLAAGLATVCWTGS